MAIAPNGERSKGKDPILLKSSHLSLARIDKSGIKVSPSLPWANFMVIVHIYDQYGGVTCVSGRMVNVNKGEWDRSQGIELDHGLHRCHWVGGLLVVKQMWIIFICPSSD
ncbi:MAG: hypothetical protein LVT47_02965 [Cyanobacteria bacterium LVE1205-1]|jgi:hypothetical protein